MILSVYKTNVVKVARFEFYSPSHNLKIWSDRNADRKFCQSWQFLCIVTDIIILIIFHRFLAVVSSQSCFVYYNYYFLIILYFIEAFDPFNVQILYYIFFFFHFRITVAQRSILAQIFRKNVPFDNLRAKFGNVFCVFKKNKNSNNQIQ